jgi:DtxR family Mn-dependent transcriptional regulator
MTSLSLLFLLLSGIALVLAAIFLLRGRRSGRARPGRRRVRIEDALKHLHDAEYRDLPATIESLAGAMEVTGDQAARVVEDLEYGRLVDREGTALRLTADGRAYARRILRVHRLWERYLAEETGVDEIEWHRRAEKREHRMSAEETEALAARMGQPAWDPHGDPIPTASGELPPQRGVPLPALPRGAQGTIVHLEDEPETLYAQLVDRNLHVGMTLQMVEASPGRLRLLTEGRSLELSPVAAANVTVLPLAGEAPSEERFETLASLAPGDVAQVVGISPGCVGPQRRRLLDLGLVPGTVVAAEMSSAGGDPIAYRVRGSLIALREDQARWIRVEREGEVRP